MKPFNITAAKAGKRVCTRDGREVRILCWDADCDYPLLGLIRDNISDSEYAYGWQMTGARLQCTCDSDLMMATEQKEAWGILNQASSPAGAMPAELRWLTARIFCTKEEAEAEMNKHKLAIAKLTWEE